MSWSQFVNDLEDFNFSHAGSRAKDWLLSSAWPGVKGLVKKAADTEETILETVIKDAAAGVLSGRLTTDNFVTAGKNALAELVAKNITTFNMQYVMALINAEVAPHVPPAVPAAASPDQQAGS